jgi:hypothetical protein
MATAYSSKRSVVDKVYEDVKKLAVPHTIKCMRTTKNCLLKIENLSVIWK